MYLEVEVLQLQLASFCEPLLNSSYVCKSHHRNSFHMRDCTHVNRMEKLKSQRSSRLLFSPFS